MQGELISGDPSAMWRGASIDSRRIQDGELFFALAGESTDGHRFAGDALGAGAAAVVVDGRALEALGGAVVRVDSPFEALHRLTAAVRGEVPGHLVAVTGSIGKTTTKELLSAMLACRYRTAASPGNLNNLYGFPLALLGIPDDTEWMVAEMGMSTPGELRQVSLLGRPDVAVFTNVREAHLESFGSLEKIAAAKAELLAGLADDAIVVANADDRLVRWIASQHRGEVVFYGRERGEVRARGVESVAGRVGSRFDLVVRERGVEERAVEIELPLHGDYNVDNFLAAAACAHRLGVDLAEIAGAMRSIEAQPGRGVVHRLAGGVVLVDDSYNSNPDAVLRALESSARLATGRIWAVLGDMLELGGASGELHRRIGSRAARLGFSPIFGVGELSRELVNAAEQAGARTRWFAAAADAAPAVCGSIESGDLILIKGSRGVGLEVVVAAALGNGES